VTALLLLALSAATVCPQALTEAAQEPPASLAARAPEIARRLEREGPGLALAVAEAAQDLADAKGRPEASAAERFRLRLRAHCRLSGTAPAPGASPADRARLAEILSRPELAPARTGAGPWLGWVASLWERLLELLGSGEAGRYAASGRTVFFACLAAALALAVAWTLSRRAVSRRQSRSREAAAASTLPLPDESDALAEASLARGQGREALRHAFLALLAALERAGRVPRGRALTNRELSELLAARTSTPAAIASPALTALAAGFAELAARFDQAVYGGSAVAAEEARTCLDRSRALRALDEGAGA
jgi:hypothetical protein